MKVGWEDPLEDAVLPARDGGILDKSGGGRDGQRGQEL